MNQANVNGSLNNTFVSSFKYILYDLSRYYEKVSDIVNLYANLSSVDGALILDHQFNLIGYGAEIRINKDNDNYEVYPIYDDLGKLSSGIDMVSFGTRHRSSFRYANENALDLIFTISQDGVVKAITKKDDKVIYWDNIENIFYNNDM